MKIASLLPSATEIVCSLDLVDQLVGVSHECDFPTIVRDLPHLTRSVIPTGLEGREIDAMVREQLESDNSLYHLDIDMLRELAPDLIVTQTLCNVCAVSESEVQTAMSCLDVEPAVLHLSPMSLKEVFDSISKVAVYAGCPERADRVISELGNRVDAVVRESRKIDSKSRPRVAFLEWIDPFFNAGHWNPELIQMAGGIDCLGNVNQPSKVVKDSHLVSSQPDILFIAQCGFDEERTRRDLSRLRNIDGWDCLPCVKNGRIYYSDGNAYFSRPGPRLVDSLEILANALHPNHFQLPAHLNRAVQFKS